MDLDTRREKRCILTRRENLWRVLICIATAAVLSKVHLAAHGRAKQGQTRQQRKKHNHVFVVQKYRIAEQPRQSAADPQSLRGAGISPHLKKKATPDT